MYGVITFHVQTGQSRDIFLFVNKFTERILHEWPCIYETLVLCSLPESNIHEGIVYEIIQNYISIPDKKRNAPLRTIQLSGRSQVIGQFSLYQCKGMPGTAALHVFCNQASKLC